MNLSTRLFTAVAAHPVATIVFSLCMFYGLGIVLAQRYLVRAGKPMTRRVDNAWSCVGALNFILFIASMYAISH